MAGFIREMMPDNIPEIMLTGGLSFGCYMIFSYYSTELGQLKEFNKDSLKMIQDQEKQFLRKIEKLQKEHQEYCERNTLSEEAKSYIRGMV